MQKGKTMNDDSISRQAAIKALNNYEIDAPDYMSEWAQKLLEAFKGDIIGLISELPSAEPKRGRWIEASTDGAVFCSECGTEWLSESAKYYKYCPICGAKME